MFQRKKKLDYYYKMITYKQGTRYKPKLRT